ncbi:MAG TPA: class I SAM-dependent methyltransferase [Candidatus Paceibacterota bacterium]|nr:class I SAM-dependent methyltransferase [Candidatus Paceibacterota bacterium]
MKLFINNIIFKLTGHRLYKVDMTEYTYGKNGDRPELYAHIPKDLSGKILDIGSAYGSWAKDNFRDVTTMDQMGKADVRGDILATPFKDGEFDAIFCFEVLEHVKDPFRAAAEIHRVLAPEGRAFISTPFSAELHGEEYGDYWRFTRQGLGELFKGFSSAEIIHFGRNELKPHHYLVKAVK